MGRRKNRERAEAGWLFRNGHLVRREEVERPAHEARVAAARVNLVRDHHLTIIGGRIYTRREPESSQSDAGVDIGDVD